MSTSLRIVEPRPRAAPRESVVPMINIVFLLLIFFLMTAQIAPPEPFEVALPEAEAEAGDGGGAAAPVLHIAADGRFAFGGARGEAAWEALGAYLAANPDEILLIRADAALEGAALAALLPRLAALGLTRVRLATEGG